jgi:hypothetical protein
MPDRTGLPLSPGDPVWWFLDHDVVVRGIVLKELSEDKYLIQMDEMQGVDTKEPFVVDGARLQFFGGNSA